MLKRTIPSSGEQLPVIGLGTWQTFDVADSSQYPDLSNVLYEMHAAGGALIDSSPMYGRSEAVIGDISGSINIKDEFFYATKVWTSGRERGIRQMKDSMQKMKRKTIDLMQIHNLLDWQTHLPVLREWKESGIIKYIGITHYKDDMHTELESIITKEKIDFVQFNYSIDSRHAEERLLKSAAEFGVATIINRPFGVSKLFNKVKGKELPTWAIEVGILNWSNFFLKFILAHPAVTCVIPATSNPLHAKDNFTAGNGDLPNEGMRNKMVKFIEGL